MKKELFVLYFRNFIFGVEDSLVSTVGLLSGVAVTGVPRSTIVLTGVVLIVVEAFSMGVGSYLSERSTEGFFHRDEHAHHSSAFAAVVMFFSYFFAGFIPIFPYTVFDKGLAFWGSIIGSLVSLFILGLLAAKISHIKLWNSAFRMFIIGGLAIALGVIVGYLVNTYAFIA